MVETNEKRKLAILEELANAHRVLVSDLSQKFGVSEVSIRRDLEELEARGLLRRVWGGAVSVPQTILEWSFNEKMMMHKEQKERIGRAAAALVKDGDVIIMDSGTTVVHVARHISRDILTSGHLTVITSSLPIVRELGCWKGVHLILLGGIYLPQQEVVAGPQSIACLSGLHADKMFLGAGGLSLEVGATTATVLDAEVDRACVKASDQVIAVIDSSKIGRKGLATVVPLTDIDILITDDGAPPDFVAQVTALGVEVRIV
ncbi:MAG: DeoR/GlpR family DNA-binding transcription regulator [Anaerolineae bacterium]